MTSTPNRSGDRVEAFLAAIDAFEPRGLTDQQDAFRVFARFISRAIDARYLERHPIDELLPDLEHLMAAGVRRLPDEIKVSISEVQGGHAVLTTCMPDQLFLYSVVRISLETLGLRTFRWLNTVVPIRRGGTGEISTIGQRDAMAESFIWTEIEGPDLESRKTEIEDYVRGRLEACQRTVRDFPKIRSIVQGLARRSVSLAQQRPDNRVAHENNARLLRWLLDHNFVFFGCRYLPRPGAEPGDEVGDWGVGTYDDWRAIPIEGAEQAVHEAGGLPPFLWVRKSKNESWIYRPGRTDHVLVQCYCNDGRPAGLLVIEGLFSYEALAKPRTDIPLLDSVIDEVFTNLQATKGSHRYRTLRNAFNSLPLEYLFALQAEDVREILEQILEVDTENRVQVHVSTEESQSFAFVFVTLPRSHYSDDLRSDVRRLLHDRFRASSIDDGVYYGNVESVAVHYFLTGAVELDRAAEEQLRDDIEEMTSLWTDRLLDELQRRHGGDAARRLHVLYSDAFPTRYREETSIARAVTDIELLEAVENSGEFDCDLYREKKDKRLGVTRLRLFETDSLLLSDILPILDNFGLVVMDEFPTTVQVRGQNERVIATFRISGVQEMDLDLLTRRNRLRAAVRAVVRGGMDNEPLNRLLLRADIPWAYVSLIRGYQNYARLLGFPYTAESVRDALLRHPNVVRALTELFRSRFDPGLGGMSSTEIDERRNELVERNRRSLLSLLEGVSDVTSYQLLLDLKTLVEATVRTNFYARSDPEWMPHIVLKFDPSLIERIPEPRLYREIYVHHPLVAGLHLRGGPVARGGIRWSDRKLDFRTEVLGLATTQNLKNVLIVPRGAKGAFVLRHPPADYSRARAAAEQMYKVFIGGLLEVTDNLVGGQLTPPANVLRYDPPDHYLVVAADKGTAHLSDTANAIAEARGFWLRDAFASGGSRGYDHKKEGITARGAWECVKRHFAEMGMDPEVDRIRVVGIGDMSGDVFGNGMLLSKSMQLVAAFDHRNIFIDPDPDPEESWKLRQMLFDRPRSSWTNYPADSISDGGGVWERSAKRIALSPEAQRALGLTAESMSGPDLIKAILAAPVDLLWNGGIGTYVKASSENNLDVGDPANDSVRIDAKKVRAKVVGEGGNLGITNPGRIELAERGVSLNTDAVDNSAGVDMSDHEVNLKILFQGLMDRGELDGATRDELLEEIKAEVSSRVLNNNWVQSRMISLDRIRSKRDTSRFKRAMDFLSERVPFNRRGMFLPGERILALRAKSGDGMYRPELAILCANAKLDLRQQLAEVEELDLEGLKSHLLGYFPPSIVERFEKEIFAHPLAINIAQTVLTNEIIGDTGATWLAELTTQTGRSTGRILEAYMLSSRLLKVRDLKHRVRGLEKAISAEVEYRVRLIIEDALESICSWLLRRSKPWNDRYTEAFDRAMEALPDLVSDEDAEAFADLSVDLRMSEVPQDLAETLVVLQNISDVLDIARLSAESNEDVGRAGAGLFKAGAFTGLSGLIRAAELPEAGAGLERPARLALRDQLRRQRVQVAAQLLSKETDLEAVGDETNGFLGTLRQDLQPLVGGGAELSSLVIAADRVSRRLRVVGR